MVLGKLGEETSKGLSLLQTLLIAIICLALIIYGAGRLLFGMW